MILVNGRPAATLSVMDRGLMYGDGAFRTMRLVSGQILHWERHWAKLQDDLARLQIVSPSRAELESDLARITATASQGVVKVVVTRGEGVRGYAPVAGVQPTRIVMHSPPPVYPEENIRDGVRVHLCQIRLARQPRLAGIKHLNRLENVLARLEWSDPGVVEGILCDENGLLIEGVTSNLFLLEGRQLVTPDLRECGVAGITRDLILEYAPRLNLAVSIAPVPLERLIQADEVWLSNSLIGLWFVREAGTRRWTDAPIGMQMRNLMELH